MFTSGILFFNIDSVKYQSNHIIFSGGEQCALRAHFKKNTKAKINVAFK